MILPLQISYRNIERTDELERSIREEVARLETFDDRIIGCHVMVEVPHEHHEHGRHVHVRIDLVVPGAEILVRREPSLHSALQQLDTAEDQKRFEIQAQHEHVFVALGDAFDVARRRLQDHVRRTRGAVKLHEGSPRGRVSSLFPDYGFIQTTDGREVYFHRNSVLDGRFDGLNVGSAVRFAEEEGEEGPQASTVHVVPHEGVAG